MSLPKYGEYRHSGVEWIGAVPSKWEVVPLKHVADFVNGATFKSEDWSDVGTPIIRIENLNGSEKFNCIEGDIEKRYLVKKDSLLFGWSGNRGTSFGPFFWRHEGVFALNQHIFYVHPFSASKNWLYWTLKAVTRHVEDQASGIIGMVHITKGDLGAVRVPRPDLVTQERVANFLDRETGKIDALIAEQEKLIALLAEKRQTTISHAVTRGLNPNAPMKDSGVAWLGEVPVHWDVCLLKTRFASMDYGISESLSAVGTVAVLRMGNIIDGQIRLDDLKYVPEVEPEMLLEPDDLLFNRTNSIALVGKVGLFEGAEAAVSFASYLVRLRVKSGSVAKYFSYLLNAPGLLGDVRSRAFEAIGQCNLNPTRYGQMLVAVPPEREQLAIAAYLENEVGKIDVLEAEAEQAITLFKERRSALIAAAVTGQIDVRSTVLQELAS